MSRYHTERWVGFLAVGLCGVMLILFAGALTATEAPLDPYNQGEQGTSRLTEASDGTVAVSYAALSEETTPETAIVIGGGSGVTTADVTAVQRYLSDGGTVVLLTEDEQSNQLLAALGMTTRIATGYLLATRSQASQPAQFVVSDSGDSALRFTGVQVNAAKPLGIAEDRDSPSRRVLARSAPAGRDLDGDGRIDETEPQRTYPVAVAESVGAGRVIVVGDANLLTNGQWQIEGTRRLARTLTADGAVLVYSQTVGFAGVSQLRLALQTPLGTVLGLPVFCGIAALIVWLGVQLYSRNSESQDDRTLRFTFK